MGSPSDPSANLGPDSPADQSQRHGCCSLSLGRITVMRTALIDFSQDKSHGPSQADRGEEEKVFHRGGRQQGAAAGPHDRRRHRPAIPRRGGSPAAARSRRERTAAARPTICTRRNSPRVRPSSKPRKASYGRTSKSFVASASSSRVPRDCATSTASWMVERSSCAGGWVNRRCSTGTIWTGDLPDASRCRRGRPPRRLRDGSERTAQGGPAPLESRPVSCLS